VQCAPDLGAASDARVEEFGPFAVELGGGPGARCAGPGGRRLEGSVIAFVGGHVVGVGGMKRGTGLMAGTVQGTGGRLRLRWSASLKGSRRASAR
jgi:hypothetical protein